MYAAGYVGDASDQMKIRKMEKQREERRKMMEDMKNSSKDKVSGAGLREFGASMNDKIEQRFGEETVGLVTKAEFIEKRRTIAERTQQEEDDKNRLEEEQRNRVREEMRRKEKELAKSKLSFLQEEEEAEDDEPLAAFSLGAKLLQLKRPGGGEGPAKEAPGGSGRESGAEDALVPVPKKFRITKNPDVDTSFLPDKEREELERIERERLKKEWLTQQEVIKNEPLEITFSYWDGTGHRRKVTARKGDSIGQFLAAVQRILASDFREIRSTNPENLMFIKEDIILPHHVTFYELVMNRARGKSGPLFDFSAREDIRLQHDASKETDASHAGKVVGRHWYDKNKHIFPANRWETYDPTKVFDSYTVKGPGDTDRKHFYKF